MTPAEQAAQWRRRYEAGESVRAIAKSTGWHWHTVLRHIKRAGVRLNLERRAEERRKAGQRAKVGA